MGLGRILPRDWANATLLGRMDLGDGPTPVLVRAGVCEDMTGHAPTVSALLNRIGSNDDLPQGRSIGHLSDFPVNLGAGDIPGVQLLAPVDLQCIKAAGVTFAVSTLERVIEERARGDAGAAEAIRSNLASRIGGDLRKVEPGSEAAARLKAALIADGLWSQYLEVAIGPDAEIFTKTPVLAAVGAGDKIGIRSDSAWNNPEPEIVLVCDGTGAVRGATLGNDVNLRDFEGRSALLLGKAKDNNASCALGPFIRLFDAGYGIDDVRTSEVWLEIEGKDNYRLEGASNMSLISRDPLALAAQARGRHHQYPDGFALFLGTLFAPVQDRDVPGQGFTHKPGDVVRIGNDRLGVLENEVVYCEDAPAWVFGISALMQNLASRGLL